MDTRVDAIEGQMGELISTIRQLQNSFQSLQGFPKLFVNYEIMSSKLIDAAKNRVESALIGTMQRRVAIRDFFSRRDGSCSPKSRRRLW